MKKDNLSKTDRERVKLASRSLLESVRKLIAPLERWTDKEQTQAEVEVGMTLSARLAERGRESYHSNDNSRDRGR